MWDELGRRRRSLFLVMVRGVSCGIFLKFNNEIPGCIVAAVSVAVVSHFAQVIGCNVAVCPSRIVIQLLLSFLCIEWRYK